MTPKETMKKIINILAPWSKSWSSKDRLTWAVGLLIGELLALALFRWLG